MKVLLYHSLVVLLALSSVACDPLGEVDIVNAAPFAVLAYQSPRESGAKGVRLEPGGRIESAWLWPGRDDDPRLRTVEAYDEVDRLIFCKRNSYRDLVANGWLIRIEPVVGC